MQDRLKRNARRQFLQQIAMSGTAYVLAACGAAPPTRPTPIATATSAPTNIPRPPITNLSVICAEAPPSAAFQQLLQEYQAATGVQINLTQEPLASFEERLIAEFSARSQTYDLIVADPRWLGSAATKGYYVELTPRFMNDLRGNTLDPVLRLAYTAYPPTTSRFWGYPLHVDAIAWCYRTDLFADPREQAAFKQVYGRKLDIPQHWAELQEVAEFFTRPDQGLYGVSLYTGQADAAITLGYSAALFAWGGEWSDPATLLARGSINSPAAIDALNAYRDLSRYTPPTTKESQPITAISHYSDGQAAIAMGFCSRFAQLLEPSARFTNQTGFFANPAGPTGHHATPLGGYTLSINSSVSDDRKTAALDFLRWFASDVTQTDWIALGGHSCQSAILQSLAFADRSPYHPVLIESLTHAQRLWNGPVAAELLAITQRELHAFVVEGTRSAQATLDTIAQQHDTIIQKAGL